MVFHGVASYLLGLKVFEKTFYYYLDGKPSENMFDLVKPRLLVF